jgi:hypothetical protein
MRYFHLHRGLAGCSSMRAGLLNLPMLAIVLMIVSARPSQAGLISAQYDGLGVTEDTATGLVFLNMSYTRGTDLNQNGDSVDQVLNSQYVLSDGFQFATLAQVTQLFSDAGITDFSGAGVINDDSCCSTTVDSTATLLLLDLMGNVNDRGGPHQWPVVQGFAIDPNTGDYYVPYVEYVNDTGNSLAGCTTTGVSTCQQTDLTAAVGTGAFLFVDTSAPEPGSVALLVSGQSGSFSRLAAGARDVQCSKAESGRTNRPGSGLPLLLRVRRRQETSRREAGSWPGPYRRL